jgi:site-specific DNA recombinase
MTHSGKMSERRHEAVIARGKWDATHLLMTNKAPRERKNCNAEVQIKNAIGNALLSGILYDETVDRVAPSLVNKAGVGYRNCVSMRLLHEGKKDSSSWLLPAKRIEDVVLKELGHLLTGRQRLYDIFNMAETTIPVFEKISAKSKLLSNDLSNDNQSKAHAIFQQVIDRIALAPQLLTIALNRKKVAALLDVQVSKNDHDEKTNALSVPFALKRRGNEAKLIIGDHAGELTLGDEALIKIISNAYCWMQQLQSGATTTVVEIAKAEALDDGEVSRVLPLAANQRQVLGYPASGL